MGKLDVAKLQPGDEVFWNDPDDGICSRYYTIQHIELNGNIVCITDVDGSSLEAFAHELS